MRFGVRMKSRSKIAIKVTEHQEQSIVIDWWAHVCTQWGIPAFALFAVPNANALYGQARNRFALMQKMKDEGMRAGIPDLVLAVVTPVAPGLYVEMKRRDGTPSDVSPEQTAVVSYLRRQGYHVVVAFGADEAMKAIGGYLSALPGHQWTGRIQGGA